MALNVKGHLYLPALTAALILWAATVDAATTRGGGLGLGTRAMGMGGAFVSVADDGSAAYWNPAGLVQLSETELLGMYGSLFNDKTRNTYLTVHYPTVDDIHLSLSASNLFYSELSGPHEDDYSVSMAIPVSKDRRLSAGLNVHYYYTDLRTPGGVGRGMGADLGLLYRRPLKDKREFAAGIALTDVSTKMRFNSGVEQDVSRLLVPGVSFHFSPNTLVALDLSWAADRDIPADERLHFRGGLEHWIFDHQLGFRTGYISYSNMPGMTSVGISYSAKRWNLDYAFLNHPEELGNSHRISAGWKLGARGGSEEASRKPSRLECFVSDSRIQVRWDAPSGVGVEGYRVYVLTEGERNFRRVQPEVLTTTHCLLRGARNGQRYRVRVTAVVEGKEGPSTPDVTVIPRPMSEEARHYYLISQQKFEEKEMSASLYAARKAEELDPNNYEIKLLLQRFERVQQGTTDGNGDKP